MVLRHIWIKRKDNRVKDKSKSTDIKYNLYDTYETWEEAHKIAKWQKKKNKSRYYIQKYEHEGLIFTKTRYALYLDKVWVYRIGW